jgi:hypothetical protein
MILHKLYRVIAFSIVLSSLILLSCRENQQVAPVTPTTNSIDGASSLDYILDTVSAITPLADSTDDDAFDLSEQLKKILPAININERKFYIVEGDLLLDGLQLYFYAKSRIQGMIKLDQNISKDTSYISDHIETRALTVATTPSGPAIWPAGKVVQYAVLKKSFESNTDYQNVVLMMRKAVSDWMGVCNIRFQYMPAYDNLDPDAYPEQPLDFLVREYNSGKKFLAMAFFPGEPKYKRRLLVDPELYTTTAVSNVGVLRHELGHVLGFRHEQIWSKEPECQGESVVLEYYRGDPVTPYDPYSVMHYLCGKSGSRKLELTEFDKEGARKVYP